MAAPLTRLTSTLQTLVWDSRAEDSFGELKRLFTSAPILTHPDPSLQFIVDASDSGDGAVLSQRFSKDNKIHPYAYFSHSLSLAERNYDGGRRELLAIKMALEEWRQWLEGAEVPFVILTDHKNLPYLQQAKRLNPHQVRWSLFSSCFNFIINSKPVPRM